jgi:hypothetical protein
VAYKTVKHLPTIRKIPDESWDEIRLILPPELVWVWIAIEPIEKVILLDMHIS